MKRQSISILTAVLMGTSVFGANGAFNSYAVDANDYGSAVSNAPNSGNKFQQQVIIQWSNKVKKPENVTLKLYKKIVPTLDGYQPDDVNDGTLIKKVTVPSSTMLYSFDGLEKQNSDGTFNYYYAMIDDSSGENYDVMYTRLGSSTSIYVYSAKPTTTQDADIKLLWNDSNNSAGKRPNVVDFRVKEKDTPETVYVAQLKKGTGDTENSWSKSINFKKDSGDLTAEKYEIKISIDGYEVSTKNVEADNKIIFAVTATYKPTSNDNTHNSSLPITEPSDIAAARHLNISVDSIWDDKNNVDNVRPERFEVRLFADGKDTGKKISIKSIEGSKETFGVLPIYNKDGSRIVYTVVADNYKYYTSAISNTKKYYTKAYGDETIVENYEFTFTNKHVPFSKETIQNTPTSTDRVSGTDRIQTAIEISKKYFGRSDTVIIARHDLFPDSMTATVLSKQLNAPILLTNQEKLSDNLKDEITRLGAKDIIIVGGPNSVSDAVKSELNAFDSNIERISGVDRYETSDKVARRVVGITGIKNKAVIASGEVFPDALSISSFAAKNGYPILLVKKNDISPAVRTAMSDLKITGTYIVGGENTISKATEKNITGVLERISGEDRYSTSVAIAKSKFPESKKAFLASGEIFADALVIGPVGAKYDAPILLTPSSKVSRSVSDYIKKSSITSLVAVGGQRYVPDYIVSILIK